MTAGTGALSGLCEGVDPVNEEMTITAADAGARRWDATTGGAFRPGSDAHKAAFCRMLLDTHDPYKPAAIEWPALDAEARDRLVSLPIWDIAVQTEGKASARVRAYAGVVSDRLLREAVLLNGFEEARHKQVLANLVAAYRIGLAPEPVYTPPRRLEWAFMVTGFSECIDSFFAFGLFAVARQSRFFPPELVNRFEPIMQEEARHILFFINWVAWHWRNLAWWRRPFFWGKVVLVWAFLIGERIGLARSAGTTRDGKSQDNSFTLTGSKAVADIDLSLPVLLDLCLAENARRMSGYDARLLRPQAMPRLMCFARRFLRAPRKSSGAMQETQ
jgi:hypothetical protein